MRRVVLAIVVLVLAPTALAQEWSQLLRGSWVREGPAQADDAIIADGNGVCDIVVPDSENSAVKQAAAFLAGDIEKITGKRPAIVAKSRDEHRGINIYTAPLGSTRWIFSFEPGAWEAFDIRTSAGQIYVNGSDFRGTAFAAYTLSERLGIDPLYHWTGYAPVRRATLV